MKISLLLAAILVGLTAMFGLQQKEKINQLTTEWEELRVMAIEKNISTDPDSTISKERIRRDSMRTARESEIKDLAAELLVFTQKMDDLQKAGNMNHARAIEESIALVDKLTNLNSEDLKVLLKTFYEDSTLEKYIKQDLVLMSLMRISSENPEAAIALFTEILGLGDDAKHMLPTIIMQYGNKDPVGAAAWLQENEETIGAKEAEKMRMALLTSTAKSDIKTALALASSFKLDEEIRIHNHIALGVTAATKDDFLGSLQGSDLTEGQRRSAFQSLGHSPFIREDFKKASEWLDRSNLSVQEKESFIKGMSYHQTKEFSAEWIDWIGKQEVSQSVREGATREFVENWASDNYVASGEWIQTQEEGPIKNAAIRAYAETLSPYEPAAAADWASALPSGPERTSLLQNIYSSLQTKDPDAAAALAEEHQLNIE